MLQVISPKEKQFLSGLRRTANSLGSLSIIACKIVPIPNPAFGDSCVNLAQAYINYLSEAFCCSIFSLEALPRIMFIFLGSIPDL